MWINVLEDWSLHMHKQKKMNMSIMTDFMSYKVIAPMNERKQTRGERQEKKDLAKPSELRT
jgi:hypothetical protein